MQRQNFLEKCALRRKGQLVITAVFSVGKEKNTDREDKW